MSTWGIAVISLGLLLIAYQNWFGLLIIIVGAVMILVSRNQKKKADQLAEEVIENQKNEKIKSRK
ncbi:hypothetical protein [Lactococcus fujiensis]|uniref:hypothetical protein n=1 Tax=Lactococcus fujiensis TaxID=610251 RepID=UPI000BDF6D2D|nr:hypothetical protein [Lactococcus fujiensis]